MRRREFLGAIAGVAASWPLAAKAQRPQRSMPLLGAIWLGNVSSPIYLPNKEAFSRGLRENGYVEGQNIAIEERFSGNDPQGLRRAAEELVQLNVDVILAPGTAGTLAAKRVTDTIPIVGGSMADPVADGLVASLARPGGNVTGTTFIGPELGLKRLQLLTEVVPGATRFAALQQPKVYSERTMQSMVSEIEEKARGLGFALQLFSASRPEEFEAAFNAMTEWRADALLTFPSPMFYVNYKRRVDLAAKHRMPTMYVSREEVKAGGLICYGADIPDLSRLAARYIAKILQGAKPGDLPVEQPTKFDLVINLRTAKALGLSVPPTLLARADEVIE